MDERHEFDTGTIAQPPRKVQLSGVLVTQDGLERLEGELERLREEQRALASRLGQALELGGPFAENGEYLDARHDQTLLDHRIAAVERRLRAAEVVEPAADGEVEIGERVTVLDLTSGATVDYRIVGTGEADPALGAISHESPIGSALLGRRVGDVVEVEAPGGLSRLEVVEVDE